MQVIAPDFLAIRSRRNNGRGVHGFDALQKAGRIERFICNDGTDILQAINQVLGPGDVMSRSIRQSEPGEITQSINGRMNLGNQAPTRTAKTLFSVFFEAPAACWCARTIVLSRNTSSKLASSHSVEKMVCQTLLSAQREKRLNTLSKDRSLAASLATAPQFWPSRALLQQTTGYSASIPFFPVQQRFNAYPLVVA